MNVRHRIITALGALLALALARPAAALDPASKDPRAIMRAVSQRPRGDRAVSRLKMLIRDGSGSRERVMRMRGMNFESGKKTLIVFEGPPDVRNTGFLSVDYDGGHADEQWLYSPNLQRVTRVPAGGRSGSFMGSDFTYADLAERDFEDYELALLEPSAKVGDEECWLIEATPRSGAVRDETGYEKTQLWISKQKLAPLQLKAWLTRGHKLKYIKASDFEKIDDVWTPRRMQAKTVRDNAVESETVIEVLNVKYGAAEVTEADFTQRRLEQGL